MSMSCPVDDNELVVTDRAGIEIDWCPTCRGVWLDRGELDKLVERSAAESGRHRERPDRGRGGFDDDLDHDDDDDRRSRSRRRGFLGDVFEFG